MDSPSTSGSSSRSESSPTLFTSFNFDLASYIKPEAQKVVQKKPADGILELDRPEVNFGEIYGPIGSEPPTTIPDTILEWSNPDFDYLDDEDDDDHHLLEEQNPEFEKVITDVGALRLTALEKWCTKMVCLHSEEDKRLFAESLLGTHKEPVEEDNNFDFEWDLPFDIDDSSRWEIRSGQGGAKNTNDGQE
jgi:hypothetical protein